jgi:hypothetical protein
MPCESEQSGHAAGVVVGAGGVEDGVVVGADDDGFGQRSANFGDHIDPADPLRICLPLGLIP